MLSSSDNPSAEVHAGAVAGVSNQAEIDAHPEVCAKARRWSRHHSGPSLFDAAFPLKRWEELDVHHFEGVPIPATTTKTRTILSQVLQVVSGRDGYYGAGGGLLHVLFLPASSVGRLWTEENPPTVSELSDILHLSRQARNVSWFVTLDPSHQTLFPRDAGSDESMTRDTLEALWEREDPNANVLARIEDQNGTLQCVNLLPHVRTSFPDFSKSRFVYFAPLVEGVHDGDCPSNCPRNNSCYTSAPLPPSSSFDFIEMPRFAFLQTTDGDVVGLMTQDFLD